MYSLRHFILLILKVLFCIGLQSLEAQEVQVSNPTELTAAISEAEPGTQIVMANGAWKDVQIKFYGRGTKKEPIILRAETAGMVFITGQSDLKLGGEHLIVDGLYFTNGASPSRSVIQYFIDRDTLANHCQVTNCVIEDYNKSQRNKSDLWVAFKGRHNELDHCYLAGKANKGPTIRVDIAGNRSIKNYHRIHHNHFGPRPPKGGPSAETIQIGNSSTSMSPSNTIVSDNLFDRCDGEVEIISSKTNFNEFRNNVFYKSEGSLVTRHGNYCTIDGNYFIGDKNSSKQGGIRLIGTGHWVTNNYFYNLRGEIFRAPLAVMNGIKKSSLNRYIQVTDVVVAHNTYVDCTAPWQFGVGSNVDQKEVLPASEIRSETPIRTLVANNIIYNTEGDPMPIFRHDSIDGVEFKSNVINNNGVEFRGVKGLRANNFAISEIEENIWVPSNDFKNTVVHEGFEFDQITTDLFGNSRADKNSIGATAGTAAGKPAIMKLSKYGPSWHDPNPAKAKPTTYKVATSKELVETLAMANNGDIVKLSASQYEIGSSLKINKRITIESAMGNDKTTILYKGTAATPAFEMNPQGDLTLSAIKLVGTGQNFAFATLDKNMSSHYNLKVIDSEITNFDFVLKAYKYSFARDITFNTVVIAKCNNGIELSGEDDDRGDYNAENLYILNCEFDEVKQNVIDYYRGGYDESTVGGSLNLKGSSFIGCGAEEKNGTLINTYGIINVNIVGNEFSDNKVKLVAQLWGAKNNSESNNIIRNSGKIITQQNLPQKMMY